MIRVLSGGLSTTVQDAGRFGLYHLGVPPSGALDGFSYRVAMRRKPFSFLTSRSITLR